MGKTPLLAIHCLVYNHEPYLRECLDGFVMQKTDFSFVAIVHDDASSDKSADIIREYVEKYPDVICPIYEEENQYSKGTLKNIMDTAIQNTGAKYVAFCEGDDYWTDPYKLQKQVFFLEQHPDYSATTHQTMVINANGKELGVFRTNVKETLCVNDLMTHRVFHTASLMYRAEYQEELSTQPAVVSGDRCVTLFLSLCGKIHYSDEVMCVYRKHQGGISSWVTVELMEKDFAMIPWLMNKNSQFPRFRYASFLHKVAIEYAYDVTFTKMVYHLFWSTVYSFSYFPRNVGQLKSICKVFCQKFKDICLKSMRS